MNPLLFVCFMLDYRDYRKMKQQLGLKYSQFQNAWQYARWQMKEYRRKKKHDRTQPAR